MATVHAGHGHAHLGTEATNERGRPTLEHGDRTTALASRGSHLETDEPGADDSDPRALADEAIAQCHGVGKGA